MGVTGLWTVVQPCARPIKLETLNRKRLAVDASIWIYQFLKAVRDKEGNALRNSHVVGFFRRICKLLFFGIKPVFVFDGGAPALKRQTITGRRARREGRRDDAVRTAGKLLAVQMQRRAEEEERRRREERSGPLAGREEEPLPEEMVYVDELGMSEQEKRRNRTFRKSDAYHLPDLDVGLSEMGAPNDPRIMSQEELEEYARHFHSGEDINVYDFSKIDFGSPFFQSLPAADRYNILNAARLRSRLRMGYSKEQLDEMFPDRMAFSKFQIERVKERNELTQRLMNLNGMNGTEFVNGTQRVAGERGKEYVLVKNEGVEGGWALGVVSNKNEGERNQPIDIDEISAKPNANDEAMEDEDEFEDVPIEGMNRLPKQPMGRNHNELAPIRSDEARKARQALYDQRKTAVEAEPVLDEVEEDPESLFLTNEPQEAQMEDLFDADGADAESENDDLQRAIAMSLEKDDEMDPQRTAQLTDAMNGWRSDQPLDFNRKNAKAGRAFAQIVNSSAQASQAKSSSDNAFANSTARRLSPTPQERLASSTKSKANNGFSGPLPFESLNLGGSFLRRKKKPEEEGGFQEEEDKEKPQPLPPWFSGDVREGAAAQKAMDLEAERKHEAKEQEQQEEAEFGEPVLRKESSPTVNLDASQTQQENEVVDLESSSDGSDVEMGDFRSVQVPHSKIQDLTMDDVADKVRAEPPVPESTPRQEEPQISTPAAVPHVSETIVEKAVESVKAPSPAIEDEVEWSDSDVEANGAERKGNAPEPQEDEAESSPEPDFEDVDIPAAESMRASSPQYTETPWQKESSERPLTPPLPDLIDDEYSDPEDEELMRQMAAEAEEHARFAASLNAASEAAVSVEAYERELRQLRGQQARDRRDADEVTQVMVGECQQLLRLFGLPYITAPMEAEAQCAELVRLELVDGIVTDDSDIFLFGGTRVYKNMFNQARFVECYLTTDLEREYSLTRTKVIQIAHLLGSDYTEGLPGIGPVTALEILSEFEDLAAFKEWWTEVQQTLDRPAPASEQTGFRKKFRKNATKLFLPPSFPDARVDDAYLQPDVDSDATPFQWGVPDLDALRAFLMQTVGWGRERADEILVPVVRDMNRRAAEGTQANITRFFSGTVGAGAGRMRGLQGDHGSKSSKPNPGDQQDGAAGEGEPGAVRTDEGFAPRRRAAGSKRMQTALSKLSERARRDRSSAEPLEESAARKRKSDDEDHDADPKEPPKKARKGSARKAKGKAAK